MFHVLRYVAVSSVHNFVHLYPHTLFIGTFSFQRPVVVIDDDDIDEDEQENNDAISRMIHKSRRTHTAGDSKKYKASNT